MTRFWIVILAGLALVPALTHAQESPDSLTRSEARCERTTANALTSYAARGAACLTDCLEAALHDPSRLCGPFLFDTHTAACLDEARARTEIPLLRDCAGEDCPECYERGSCRTFHAARLADVQSVFGYAVPALYCDDSASPNGLSPAEASCRRALLSAIDRFTVALRKCEGRCHEDARAGRIPDEDACRASNVDTSAFDPSTQRCVDQARRRFAMACARKCTDAPDCLPLTCDGIRSYLEAEVSAFEPTTFCTDQPICGDGLVSGSESCDPARFFQDCAPDEFCSGSCACEKYPVCNDGQVSGFEPCDASATPNGCGEGQVCRFCAYCTFPFCGDGYHDPTEVCDPYVFPSGCAPGEACTSSCACTPLPDRCGSAIAIPPSGGIVSGSTVGVSATSGTCAGGGPEVVFTWTPETSGIATISTCGDTPLDSVVYVRSGTCQDGVEIACNDQWCGGASQVTPVVSAGTTYFIFVDSYYFDEFGGPFTLTVTAPAASPSGAFLDPVEK